MRLTVFVFGHLCAVVELVSEGMLLTHRLAPSNEGDFGSKVASVEEPTTLFGIDCGLWSAPALVESGETESDRNNHKSP